MLRHIPGDPVENVDNAHLEQAVILSGFEHNLFEYDAGECLDPQEAHLRADRPRIIETHSLTRRVLRTLLYRGGEGVLWV